MVSMAHIGKAGIEIIFAVQRVVSLEAGQPCGADGMNVIQGKAVCMMLEKNYRGGIMNTEEGV